MVRPVRKIQDKVQIYVEGHRSISTLIVGGPPGRTGGPVCAGTLAAGLLSGEKGPFMGGFIPPVGSSYGTNSSGPPGKPGVQIPN